MSVERRGTKIPPHLKRVFTVGSVRAGVLEGATYAADTITNASNGKQMYDNRTGMHVATIAAALEYGEGQNHPRPFMHQTAVKQGKEWATALRALLAQGKTASEALLTVGLLMKEDIQQTIRDWPADNSKEWAKVKGFNHGLILSGHLMNSIDSEVDD